jgi:hypothetical protein
MMLVDEKSERNPGIFMYTFRFRDAKMESCGFILSLP